MAGSETRAEEALIMTMAAAAAPVAKEAMATIAGEEVRRQFPSDPDGSRRKTLDPQRLA